MGEATKIAWTDSTVNAWHGCQKVDAMCKHCYAETQTPVRVKRAAGLELWGANAARSETKSWERDLRRWNREVRASGRVHRVFGQSLSDTFEDYTGGRVVRADGRLEAALVDLRARFLDVVAECDALTFQLLTKRPENVVNMVPASWRHEWPRHVQVGTSVGDQASADERIPHLLRVPAPVRFLSVEPMLGPVDLSRWVADHHQRNMLLARNGVWGTCVCCPRVDGVAYPECCENSDRYDHRLADDRIHWVICGGESGQRARPFDIAWARSLRDQCQAAGVPYFMKQFGAHVRHSGIAGPTHDGGYDDPWPAGVRMSDNDHVRDGKGWRAMLQHPAGADPAEWPADLRVQQFPPTA